MSRLDGVVVACAVVNTAVSVCVAWPVLRPALLAARARAARVFDQLPGPPAPAVPRGPSLAEIAAVTPSYFRLEDWR